MIAFRQPDKARMLSKFAVVCLAVILYPGCQKPAPPTEPTRVDVGHPQIEPLWDATLKVLRLHDLTPDRIDPAAGVITTHPRTSQSWGEFWRQDVADNYSLCESTLHTIQRRATVQFTRLPDATWNLDVQVDVYRLSLPESQITTASSAIHGFSGALPTVQGQIAREGKHAYEWVHLRRDASMETRLMNRIVREADLPVEAEGAEAAGESQPA